MNGTQSPEPALLPVGFWRRYEDTHDDPFDTRPWPVSSLIDDRPFNITVGDSQVSEADRMDVVEYCSLGYIESYEFGYATCRLCGANGPALGCTTLTDGTYCWPEGYSHYILHHRVSPPPSFISHAKANLEQQRADHSAGPRKLWDTQLKRPRLAPPATREWLELHAASLATLGERSAPERDRRCCCQQ